MYIYSKPDEPVETYLEGAPAGLVGTVGYAVVNLDTSVIIQGRTTGGIVEIPAGSGSYYTKVTAPHKVGNYAVLWDSGTVSPETSASDVLIVSSTGAIPPTVEGENLVTLEELMDSKGITELEGADEKRYLSAIEDASAAVRSFCDRAFGKPLSVGTRTYEYEGGGFIDIDDANAVTDVAFIFGGLETLLDQFYWRSEPQDGPPYTYLTIPHWAGIYSPEMGFTYNLDVISQDRGWPGLIPLVQVKGTWGWAEVPRDVQRATLMTAIEFADVAEPYMSENIGSYSYTTAIRQSSTVIGQMVPSAIPGRAQDLLYPYVRFKI